MEIFTEVLSPRTMTLVKDELKKRLSENVWGISTKQWISPLQTGVIGVIQQNLIEGDLRDKILKDVKEVLPKSYLAKDSDVFVKFNVWQRLSGIALHDDGHVKNACTLYLNEEWDENDGGIFLWKKDPSHKVFIGCSPVYNQLIVNSKHEWHKVSLISPLAKQDRYTLQIWEHEKEEK